MKKHFLLFVVLSAVLAPLLVSCPDAGSSAAYTVTFDSGGGSAVSPQSVQSGGTADRPAEPVQAEHSFVNWYSDATFQTVYDFDQPVTGSITLYAAWRHELKSVIESGTVPADLSAYGTLVRTVLEPYAADAAIVAKYVDVTAQGNGDASSWENAAGDIKTTVDGIADAEANKIYLVLVASGEHTPADTLGMKNHAAIVGGWNKWEQAGASTISGGNARQVFSNNGIDRTALLYGVTIADGNSAINDGGGMINVSGSSPTLINVTFSGNTAIGSGGGIYNKNNSSPTLINVTFVNNEAAFGGGIYNNSSSPTLINVTFSGNTASDAAGGGMYNQSNSSPTLSNVTFVNNEARSGGGMYNGSSSPTLNNVTFVNNGATSTGGGMFNNNDGGEGPTIVNTLFWNNKESTPQATNGQQIYMWNDDGTGAENMTISFSLVQHGITTTNATADTDQSDGLGIGGGSASVVVTQANNISGDPKLAAALADNGGFVQTIALLDNSPAVDAGAYVQRSGTAGSFTFYYSEDAANWFSDAVLSSSGSAPPADALNLTAADARGYARNGRPDIGAYEYDGTAP